MIGRVRWRFSEVDSTQNIAFRLAELGSGHGTVARADYQSRGRGRLDRSWEAPRGSALMFSVLLLPNRPVQELGIISLLVAEVLADSFQEPTTAPVQIKWPNDVMIDGQKTSGILMQTRSGAESVAVLGIGINISTPTEFLPDGATCLDQHTTEPIDVEKLYQSLLTRLEKMWSAFAPTLTGDQVTRLDSRLWLRGERVSILDADREIEGRILGVARSGGLRLSVAGSEREIVAGEIRRGPRQIIPGE